MVVIAKPSEAEAEESASRLVPGSGEPLGSSWASANEFGVNCYKGQEDEKKGGGYCVSIS
jgi:hypothetical protein